MNTPKKQAEKLLDKAGITINGKNDYDPQIHNEKLYQRVLSGGSLALGEAYMDSWWDVKNLDGLFYKILAARVQENFNFSWPVLLTYLKFKVFNLEVLDILELDSDNDGINEIIVSPTSGSIPQVGIYNRQGELQRSFLAFPSDYRGGVEIAVGDIDRNGLIEVYIVPQQAGGPQVRLFNSLGDVIGGLFAFDSANRFGTSIAIE